MHREIGRICTNRICKEGDQGGIKVQRYEIAEQVQGTEEVSFLGVSDVKAERKGSNIDLHIMCMINLNSLPIASFVFLRS